MPSLIIFLTNQFLPKVFNATVSCAAVIFISSVCHIANGIANSEDPDQTAPLGAV